MIPQGMVLDKSTTSLQLKLGAAGAIPVTVDYYDVTPQTKTDTQPLKGASYLSTTDGTNYVTICPAPAQGTVRVITYICVHDNDAGSETFTLSKVDVSTAYIQVVITLATTESAVWTPESGWNIDPLYDSSDVDINGGTIDGTAIGGTTPAAGAFTTLSASSPITAGIDGGSVAYYLPGNGAIRSVGGGIMYIDSAPTVGGDIHIRPAAIPVGVFSSTGLAVTGAISSTGNLTVTGGYIEGNEQTAPSAPAANGYRIFAEDNGSGKTRLMVQFATGAAQQIAIEP